MQLDCLACFPSITLAMGYVPLAMGYVPLAMGYVPTI